MAERSVFLTIAAAVVAWALGVAFRSRTAWAAGAVLALTHAVLAFAVFYGWSHDVAREATRRQTAALTGLDFAGGIYINYLSVMIWLADAAWWWVSPRSRSARSSFPCPTECVSDVWSTPGSMGRAWRSHCSTASGTAARRREPPRRPHRGA